MSAPADVTWKSQDCTAYLAGLIKLWNDGIPKLNRRCRRMPQLLYFALQKKRSR